MDGNAHNLTPRLNVSGGYYQQNIYAGTTATQSVADPLPVIPSVLACKLNKSFDIYGGTKGSFVTAGYFNEYL
jgi:hypothetical protein